MADTTPDISAFINEFESVRRSIGNARQTRIKTIRESLQDAKVFGQWARDDLEHGALSWSVEDWSSESGIMASELFDSLRVRSSSHVDQVTVEVDSALTYTQGVWTA